MANFGKLWVYNSDNLDNHGRTFFDGPAVNPGSAMGDW